MKSRVGCGNRDLIDTLSSSVKGVKFMNIEIAERLVKLRKQKGYSQEELADKLGLSRQAVSKWERAEASPDTDNLICLAKLYNVSLDELLNTEEDVDTIVEEQVKKEDESAGEGETKKEKPTEDSVNIGPGGIHVIDKDGSEVHVGISGIHIKDSKGGRKFHCDCDHPQKEKNSKISGVVLSTLILAALITYILLGSLLDMWYNGWVVFFIPDIIASVIRAIYAKKFSHFNISFLATFTYFFVCMVVPGLSAHLWHPMWVVFLGIPFYYTLFGPIDSVISRSRKRKRNIKVSINGDVFGNEEKDNEESDD